MTPPLLSGAVALVSGAGAGLGRSLCTQLAKHGARIAVVDRDQAAVDASVAAVRAIGGEAIGAIADITEREQCDAAVARTLGEFGRLDVLVNDAYDGGDHTPFAAADLNRWRRTTEVNVFGTLTMTQAALGALQASGSGRIIMICTHGVEVIQPSFGAYTGSKAALAHHTKLLAAELGEHAIRVNAVFPGPIWGENLRRFLEHQARARGVDPEVVHREFRAKNALGQFVDADAVADCVVFLASDLSRTLTGQALYANAGESFH
jgi:NAD(P)-dependent dehydrogenase (short-subunit alcohol dehydrogenase family)